MNSMESESDAGRACHTWACATCLATTLNSLSRTHFRLGHYCPLARDAESEYCTVMVIAEFRPHRRGVVALTKAEYSRSFEQLQPPLVVCLQRPSGAFEIWPEC